MVGPVAQPLGRGSGVVVDAADGGRRRKGDVALMRGYCLTSLALIGAHPTLPEAIMEAAHAVHGKSVHVAR